MARPLRIEYPGAWYHVMNRGRGRQKVFLDAEYYVAFLETLAESHRRFRLEVHAYCLMGNHYHLLVRTPQGNLSRAMRHINGVYTQRFNRLSGTDGALFRGRYKAILIDADSYLLSLSRYIHRNPVDMRRPLVTALEDYPWSSYPAYVNRVPSPAWLYREETYRTLGRRDRYRGYRNYVEQPVEQELVDYYQSERRAPVLGSDAFRETVLNQSAVSDAEIARWEKKPSWVVPCDDVVAAVAAVCGTRPRELYARPGRGRNAWRPERALAMWLCQEKAGLTQPEIGERFGSIHYSAVSQAIRRLRIRIDEDKALADLVKSVMSRFDP